MLEESKEPVEILILKMINSIDNSFLEYKNDDNINRTLIRNRFMTEPKS